MKIVVCLKQVPFVDQLKFDYDNKRLIREGVGSEINPFDKRAIAQAIALRQQFGGEVIVVTMGPPQAKEALVEALAMGCDRAVHLLGREFAGADTLATARALAFACQKIGYDLIFCGRYSTDAETAQVPPMLAEMLDLPQVTGATELKFSDDGRRLTVKRELDDGFEIVETSLPVVLSAAERLAKPIKVKPEDLEPARQKPIAVWAASDLSADASLFGATGSPTSVSEIFSVEPKRKRVIRNIDGDVTTAVRDTVRGLTGEGLFTGQKPATQSAIRPRTKGGSKQQAIWVVTEAVGETIRPATFELLGRGMELAEKIGGELAAVVIGHNTEQHAKTLAAHGADRVYIADAPALTDYSTEGYTAVLADAIRHHDPFAVLLPSTANGRDLAPRVAARLGIGLTGDCIGLEIDSRGNLVQLKPAFGGNIVAPILSKTRPAMATVRPGMLQPCEPDYSREANVEGLPTDHLGAIRTRTISIERIAGAGVALDDAEVIIGVGMGVGGAENLPKVQELAEALGAPVGGTRKVVDAGWLPRQLQIGLTGRSIAPQLYVALGLSGKFNHAVGIQRSRLVLAINSDPNAEIFKQCDYGIVGDWAVVVPALAEELRARGKQPL